MKVGLLQINTTVGALAANCRRIADGYSSLIKQGAEIVITPELAISGYPPRDLLLKKRFLADCARHLDELAALTGPVPIVVGFPEENLTAGRPAYNSAAWCADGEVVSVYRKFLLPTYDVFDEDRYFSPGPPKPWVMALAGQGPGGRPLRVGLTICEDLWHGDGTLRYPAQVDPVALLADATPDLILNLSASPWHRGKASSREKVIRRAAERCQCPVVYVNSVGGNDELIFDGLSVVADANGQPRRRLASCAEEQAVVDLAALPPALDTAPPDNIACLADALVLGIRDYAHKSGFSRGLVGLSGGIDSAVTAALAARALGAENILGVGLPSAISSQHSQDDARQLAHNLGIEFHLLPISDVVDAANHTLAPVFAENTPDVTEENIQARARGLLLMAISNKQGRLLLTTGNKSEMAVGYCTLYGDMAGGLAALSDVPKMQVYELADYLNRSGEVIPRSTIEKPPSAELRPEQKDEDSLPPYPVLDEILRLYVEEHFSTDEICARGFDLDTVRSIVRKVDLNEYKRKQAAPGLKVTGRAFGIGRRVPIVQHYVS